MSVKIDVLKGSMAKQTFSLNKPVINIGRDPSSNDIVLNDDTISRDHAQIMQDGQQWRIRNVSQKKKITINQRVLLQYMQETSIYEGDTILLGEGIEICFHTNSLAQQPSTPRALKPTRRVGVPLLEISINSSADKFEYPLDKPVMTIGREPSNDIVIDVPIVSKFHAQVVKDGDQFFFIHPQPGKENTSNGLLYKGRHIRGDEQFRLPLSEENILRIGNEDGGLVTLAYNDGSLDKVLPPPTNEILLGKSTLTIGRFPDNDICLDHPLVSRYHAELRLDYSGYRVIDLNSANHVYVNGQQVKDRLLNINDEIRIGPYSFIYAGASLTQRDQGKGIRIEARNLKKMGHNQAVLLNDINLVIPQCTFVAIVGGSGAGKSTLMNALNGFRPAEAGRVLYNNADYYAQRATFSTQIGYVPQDDIVHADLTVERALYYAANLRLPADTSAKEI